MLHVAQLSAASIPLVSFIENAVHLSHGETQGQVYPFLINTESSNLSAKIIASSMTTARDCVH